MSDKKVEKLKIVCVGDKQVGKTSILLRLVNNTFSGVYKPTGPIELLKYNIDINPRISAEVTLFDTVLPDMFKKADAFIIVADLSQANTLDSAMNKWLSLVGSSDTLRLANKADLSFPQLNREKYPDFHILSAKTGSNVTIVIDAFIKKLVKKRHVEEEILMDSSSEASSTTIGLNGESKTMALDVTNGSNDEKRKLLEERKEIEYKLKKLTNERKDLEKKIKTLDELLGISTNITGEDYTSQIHPSSTWSTIKQITLVVGIVVVGLTIYTYRKHLYC